MLLIADFKVILFRQGIEAGGRISGKLGDFAKDMCKNLERINAMEIKIQRMQMEKIKMETCLEIAQHTLDTGKCRGEEEACFSRITSCLDMSEMESIRNAAGGPPVVETSPG